MQYLLTIYVDESAVDAVPPEQGVRVTEAYQALTAELKEAGIFLGGEGLQRTSTATTVRVRDGERVTTDGPFAETKEQVGGFYLLECADLDEALAWARKVPLSDGAIEVRPVVDLSEFTDQTVGSAAESA